MFITIELSPVLSCTVQKSASKPHITYDYYFASLFHRNRFKSRTCLLLS